jgi:hypothetical protein
MKYVKKFQDFLLLENKQQAEKILRANKIALNNAKYINLKNHLSNTPNYLGVFTKFLVEEKIDIQELKDIHYWLTSVGWVNKLPKNPLEYNDFESLKDDIMNLEVERKANKIISELTSSQKVLIKKLSKEELEELNHLASKVYDLKYLNIFRQKISKYKTVDEIKNYMIDFIKQYDGDITYQTMIKKILSVDGAEIVYRNEDDAIIVANIKTFEASKKLGSSSWCISNGISSWKNYVTETLNKQYFIWDFNYQSHQPEFMLGVTIKQNNDIYAMHDMHDSSISLNDFPLITDLISKGILKPVSKNEIVEIYQQIISDNKKFYETNDEKYTIYAEALRKYLISENEITDDSFGIEYITPSEYDYYGLLLFTFNNKEYAIGNDSQADTASYEYLENLIEEIGLQLFNSGVIDSYIETDSLITYFIDRDEIEENYEDYGIDKQLLPEIEDEIDELNKLLEGEEDEEKIDSYQTEIDNLLEDDDNYEVDSDSLDSYIENETDEITNNPIDYLKDRGFITDDNYKFLLDYIDLENLINYIIEIDGRGHNLSSYDGIEEKIVYDDEIYYIYRIN